MLLSQGLIFKLFQKNVFQIRYSRKYLQSLEIDYEKIERDKQQQQEQQHQKNVYNLSSNDQNKENYIRIKINHPLFRKQPLSKTCAILEPQPFRQPILISAIRKYILTSIKKARMAMYCVKKQHIFQAINSLTKSHKKVAKLMIPTFYNLINHADNIGLNPLQLYVFGILIGKTRRYFGVRYHAKGRSGREKTDMCQIRVMMQYKSNYQFLKQIAQGKCPAALADYLRQKIKKSQLDYHDIVQFNSILTAKGRQQHRQLTKRQVDYQMGLNVQQGVFLPKKVVHERIVDIEIGRLTQLFEKLRKTEFSLESRQKLFSANSKK